MGNTRKITCKSLLDELSDFVDGELSQELRISLEAHLAKCPDCWVTLDETRRTVEISRSVDCHPLPDDVHQRLLSALESRWQGSQE